MDLSPKMTKHTIGLVSNDYQNLCEYRYIHTLETMSQFLTSGLFRRLFFSGFIVTSGIFSLIMGLRFICSLSVDPSLGRLDYESMSQQALMEMVISGLSEENQIGFKDWSGNFLDISEWMVVVKALESRET